MLYIRIYIHLYYCINDLIFSDSIGQCDFYMSKDRYLSVSGAVMAPKNNPLVHSFNKRYKDLYLMNKYIFIYYNTSIA